MAFLPFRAVEFMTSGLPQVCKLWLGVGKGMLPVKNVAEKNPRIHGRQLLWASTSLKVVVGGTCLP